MARAIAFAEYIWDDREDAQVWLTAPHLELSGKIPIEAVSTELGASHVEEILSKLFYGLPV